VRSAGDSSNACNAHYCCREAHSAEANQPAVTLEADKAAAEVASAVLDTGKDGGGDGPDRAGAVGAHQIAGTGDVTSSEAAEVESGGVPSSTESGAGGGGRDHEYSVQAQASSQSQITAGRVDVLSDPPLQQKEPSFGTGASVSPGRSIAALSPTSRTSSTVDLISTPQAASPGSDWNFGTPAQSESPSRNKVRPSTRTVRVSTIRRGGSTGGGGGSSSGSEEDAPGMAHKAVFGAKGVRAAKVGGRKVATAPKVLDGVGGASLTAAVGGGTGSGREGSNKEVHQGTDL
jgi:hypothetical protein